jgi:hypothetical protein
MECRGIKKKKVESVNYSKSREKMIKEKRERKKDEEE